MPRIALIGAGSAVFTRTLLGDVLSFPELAEADVRLMDIDAERLRVAEKLAHKVVEATGAAARVTSHTDQREAIDGADYVITTVQIGGFSATLADFEIPKRYGLRQTIADTLGIGGIFRGLRTIRMLVGLARDMEELCPHALWLNYANPMAMNMWAVLQATSIAGVGLCHSVQGTQRQLAGYMGVGAEELTYVVGGINHMAFFLRLEHQGEDAYPRLWEAMNDPEIRARDPVRFEAFRRLGYFVTESSEHFAEYVPWFIRRDREDLIDEFKVPLDEYVRRCRNLDKTWAEVSARADAPEPVTVTRSHEYAAHIIHSCETGEPRVIYGNVLNHGLIPNLPAECCVEVPCLVDRKGVVPCPMGPLPPQLAALMRTNINVHELTVEAALTGRREHVYHAAMLDPHTAAELTLDEIAALVDELFDAHAELLPL